MTFDEWHKASTRSALHRGTGISYDTLRKVERREPVSWDTAHALADFLGCDARPFRYPKPKRVRKAAAK